MLRTLVSICAAAGVAGTVQAQTPRDLSGCWGLNVAKSAYEQGPGPRLQTDVIQLKPPHIRLSVNSTTRNVTVGYDLSLPTDGRMVHPLGDQWVDPARRLTAASARWNGAMLVVRAELDTDSGPAVVVDRYRLSENGAQLAVRTERGDGTLIRTLVFDRCPH